MSAAFAGLGSRWKVPVQVCSMGIEFGSRFSSICSCVAHSSGIIRAPGTCCFHRRGGRFPRDQWKHVMSPEDSLQQVHCYLGAHCIDQSKSCSEAYQKEGREVSPNSIPGGKTALSHVANSMARTQSKQWE